MSFGFSVGDLIGAANLTYRLIKALHGSQDAGEEYRAAINELGCVQQALIRVSCLGSNKDFPRATFESASCIIMGSMDIIQSFLDRTKKYDRRLGGLGSSSFAHGLRKIGWVLFKAEDMKKLRETLHARLSALGVLLVAANLDTSGIPAQYLDGADQKIPTTDTETNDPRFMPTTNEISKSMRPGTRLSNQTHNSSFRSIDSGIGSEEDVSEERIQELDPLCEENREQSSLNFSSTIFLSSFSREELVSMILNQASREEKIKELSALLRALVRMGEYQLDKADHPKFVRFLDEICDERESLHKSKLPIRFKDAVGRKFSFPWHLCRTWKGMKELIKQAFLRVDVIGPHVRAGEYDLVGPDGEIILPQAWETMVRPDWAITMHMWPMPMPEPPPLPPPMPESPNQSKPEPEFSQADEMASPPPPAEPAPKLSGENAPQDDPRTQEGKDDAPTEATNINGDVKVVNARDEPPGENNTDDDWWGAAAVPPTNSGDGPPLVSEDSTKENCGKDPIEPDDTTKIDSVQDRVFATVSNSPQLVPYSSTSTPQQPMYRRILPTTPPV